MNEHLTLPTKRRSQSFCTPFLSTTLLRSYTTPLIKVAQLQLWLQQNVESKSEIR